MDNAQSSERCSIPSPIGTRRKRRAFVEQQVETDRFFRPRAKQSHGKQFPTVAGAVYRSTLYGKP